MSKIILPDYTINHILSYRPAHPISKIIKDMIPVHILDVYETNILANEMRLNCNYNFYEWYYKLHCFYIKNERFESINSSDFFTYKGNERSLKIKYLRYKNEVIRKIDWRLGYHDNKNW